jgi:hypothetical protein
MVSAIRCPSSFRPQPGRRVKTPAKRIKVFDLTGYHFWTKNETGFVPASDKTA